MSALRHDFSIVQMDLDGNIAVELYNGCEVSKETCIPYSGIYACVNGKTRKSNGFFLEEDRKVACPNVHLFLICSICPFICPTIAQIPLYVQLFVRSDFNRLHRKYECFCVLQEMVVLCPCLVEN